MPTNSDKCTLSVNQEASTVILSGITEDPLTISYAKDIELTELIIILSKRIDEGKPIELEAPTNEDEKISLIINTISEIIDEYNANTTLQEVVEGLEIVSDLLASVKEETIPS
jgi:hypothetical protein